MHHDGAWRLRRRHHGIPVSRFEAGHHRFGQGGDVRDQFRSLQSAISQDLDALVLGQRQRGNHAGDSPLHVSGTEVGHHQRAPLIRNVQCRGAALLQEQHGQQEVGRAVAGRAVGELAGIGLEVFDEFAQRVGWHRRMHDQRKRRGSDESDGVEVCEQVVAQFLAQRSREDYAAIVEQQRVAVGPGFGDELVADVAAGYGLVVHEEAGVQLGVELGGKQIRLPLLVPRLGARLAELAATPFMFVAIVLSARFIAWRFALASGARGRLVDGALALLLLVSAQLLLAVVLQARPLGEYSASRDPVSGEGGLSGDASAVCPAAVHAVATVAAAGLRRRLNMINFN